MECPALDAVDAAGTVISAFLSYRSDRLKPRDLFFAVTVAQERFQSVLKGIGCRVVGCSDCSSYASEQGVLELAVKKDQYEFLRSNYSRGHLGK